MKQTLPALILLFTACSAPMDGYDLCYVEFKAVTEETRSYDEARLESLDLLVFEDGGGRLETHIRAGGSDLIRVSLRKNIPYRWWVVANAPEGIFDGFTDEDSFRHGVNNSIRGPSGVFTMFANGALTAPSETIEASLNRYACKVSVNDISVPYFETLDRIPDMGLGRLMLIDTQDAVYWDGAPVDDCIVDIVEDLSSFPVSIYCLPNKSAFRHTVIAVELLFDGISNWYSVSLPQMDCNHHYIIESLVLIGPGSSSPDIPVSRENISFSVDIDKWKENTSQIVFDSYEND